MNNKKCVLIMNGMATAGKNTFVDFINEYIPTISYSSIDKIKELAVPFGYTGNKTEEERKLLSELKKASIEFNNLPFRLCMEQIKKFCGDMTNCILAIDIREPDEINKIVSELNGKVHCITVLIKNEKVENITSNNSDGSVFNYIYDYVIENTTLEEFENCAKVFITSIVENYLTGLKPR